MRSIEGSICLIVGDRLGLNGGPEQTFQPFRLTNKTFQAAWSINNMCELSILFCA